MLSVVGPICLGLGVIWPVIFISSNPTMVLGHQKAPGSLGFVQQ